MPSLERATSPRRAGLWSLVGLVLVPLVVAAGFLWATWDSTDRLDRVQAAVVNLDEPVTIGKQTVPLGRQLAGGLVTGGDDTADGENLDWVLTDAADAAQGLESGSYAAVVTIPENFSARATSYSQSDADDIEPATIDVKTSEAGGVIDPAIGRAITTVATSTLNTELTKQYLDGIYVGFNDLGKQFATVADAADQLAEGSSQLTDGLDRTADGAVGLADGLDQLSAGVTQLGTGATGISTGTRGLADGLDELADGTARLPAGARQLATGTSQAADGADQLAAGSTGLATGLSTYQKALREQAAQVAASVPAPTPPPASQSQPACPTTQPALTAEQCAVFLQTLGAAAQQIAQQAGRQAEAAARYAGAQGAAQALNGAADGLSTRDPKTGQSLLSGAQGLAAGQGKAAKGLDQLATGADQFADGLVPLAKGIRSTATGADQLADGAGELATGVTGLASGAQQSASGAGDLSTGVRKLADAGGQLSDGTEKLADGLQQGADAVPTYDKQTRQKLSTVVATPVDTPAPTSAFSNVTTTTFLAVLALWLGALATYLVLRAVTARVLASMQPSWRLSLEGLLPGAVIGAVQALALTVVLQLLLDLPAGRAVALGGFAVLTAVTFAALNHALVAWFGGVGRFVSVVLVVVGAAGALTAAVPESFDALRPFLPLTPALEGFRALASGGTGARGAAALLTAWLLVGLVAGVLAVTRRRVLAPLVAPVPLPS